MVPKAEHPDKSVSKETPDAAPKVHAKPDRRAAALRDNLRRRKAQVRARREGGSGSPEG
jgi:hypothetical protein